MALSDLLWNCPVCGSARRLGPRGASAVCPACSTTYRRGRGAEIVAMSPGGSPPVSRHARAWLDDLLPVEHFIQMARRDEIRRAAVTLRFARAEVPVRRGGELLGLYERMEAPRSGTLALHSDRLDYQDDRAGPTESWPLEIATAIQASSSTLQLKRRGAPVLSIRFADDSMRLWEALLQHLIRALYRQAGRGEIYEFQPRIATR